MRVATRRLRSDLRTFAAAVDPEWREEMRAELRGSADRCGDVRDLDVLLRAAAASDGATWPRLAPLFETLERRATAARDARC